MTEFNQDYLKYGINIPVEQIDDTLASCPNCVIDHPEGTTTLSVYLSLGIWHCQHCAWQGKIGFGHSTEKPWLFKNAFLPIYNAKPLSKAGETWFTKRGLSLDGAKHYGFGIMQAWNPKKHQIDYKTYR